MSSNDTVQKTVKVALLLCLVCSIVVSGAAVILKPIQLANKALDRKTNILAAASARKKVPDSRKRQSSPAAHRVRRSRCRSRGR